MAGRLIGHRQVTDAVLLHVARSQGMRLATLDGGLRTLDPTGNDLVVVPAALRA